MDVADEAQIQSPHLAQNAAAKTGAAGNGAEAPKSGDEPREHTDDAGAAKPPEAGKRDG